MNIAGSSTMTLDEFDQACKAVTGTIDLLAEFTGIRMDTGLLITNQT